MKKKTKIIIISITILLVVSSIFVIKKVLDKKESAPKNTANIVGKIEGYDYTLDDRDTKLFKEEFENLRSVLTEEGIDYDAYAISLSKLFIIDFYTINNKINKYDVGGLEYIDSRITDNFKLKAVDTIYKYVEDNSDNKRNQELPEVKSFSSAEKENTEYPIGDQVVPAVKIKLHWNYTKDYGYDSEGEITVIKNDNKLVIVDFQTK